MGMEEATAHVLGEMQLKHPQAPPPQVPEEAPAAEPLQVSNQDVHEAIRGFKPGSAPGPSGL